MGLKPEVKFGKIQVVKDGEVHRLYNRKDGRVIMYSICCDCSLTHLEEFTPRRTYIKVRVWRDDEKTEWLRKKAKIAKRKKSLS